LHGPPGNLNRDIFGINVGVGIAIAV
jgi:hypothetical protein